ncbi:ORF93R [black bullhead herpesvirus]|uniref:ORF93L n=1 Tax=black bullhead herpesvirus TaxID=508441 RepID=A0A2H5AJD6_9VIRU|nr:ORF93L [black bullhead herpesvirus]YP_009447913.1 ORF93R [black bullhead herpesvirus]AUG72265.1 ORF93L [black bullhead herpesvirus]AUG72335.1 ORF93R [black bullhead herpesvirus]
MSFQMMFSMGAEDYCSNHPNAPPGLPRCPIIFEFLETHLSPGVIDGLLIGFFLICIILAIICTVWCMRSSTTPLTTPVSETREDPEGDDESEEEEEEESSGSATPAETPVSGPSTPTKTQRRSIITPEAAAVKLDRLRRYMSLRERGFDQRFERLQTLLAIRDELMNSDVLAERESRLTQEVDTSGTSTESCTSNRISRLVRPSIRSTIRQRVVSPSCTNGTLN